MKSSNYFGAIVAIILALGTVAYAQSEHAQVGRTGHFTLKQETRVGDAVLPPGDYEVRHRRFATAHFVEFTRMTPAENYQVGIAPYEWVIVAQVPCTMKPSSVSAKSTFVETSKDAAPYIDNLRIRGENVIHVFAPAPDPSAPQNQVEYGGGGM